MLFSWFVFMFHNMHISYHCWYFPITVVIFDKWFLRFTPDKNFTLKNIKNHSSREINTTNLACSSPISVDALYQVSIHSWKVTPDKRLDRWSELKIYSPRDNNVLWRCYNAIRGHYVTIGLCPFKKCSTKCTLHCTKYYSGLK